jgi:hypothetical protein
MSGGVHPDRVTASRFRSASLRSRPSARVPLNGGVSTENPQPNRSQMRLIRNIPRPCPGMGMAARWLSRYRRAASTGSNPMPESEMEITPSRSETSIHPSDVFSTALRIRLPTAIRTMARLEAAKAIEHRHRLRLSHTEVRAPDDGLISSRSATVGAVLPAGQELFRLIHKGRLEWRAEVATADLVKLSAGQTVHVTTTGDQVIEGKLRVIAPAIDTQTRNGLVYVDLPDTSQAGIGQVRAGMFARGYFEIGKDSVHPAAKCRAAARWLQLCPAHRSGTEGAQDQDERVQASRRSHRDYRRARSFRARSRVRRQLPRRR